MPRSVRNWQVLQSKQSFSREKNQSRKERYSPKKVKRNKQEFSIFRARSDSKRKNQVLSTKKKDIRERIDSQDQNSQPTTSIKNVYAQKQYQTETDLQAEIQKYRIKVKYEERNALEQQRYTIKEKKYLIQEIETIQRQFSKFRLTIMKQLQRQEFMMRQLIQNSFEKFIYGQLFNAESETQKKKTEDLFNLPLKIEGQSKSHIYIPKLNISRTNMNAFYTERTKPQTSKQQNTKNFSRFFEAIKILRKNVEDISDVGETNSVEGRMSQSKVENRRLFMKTPKLSYN